MMLKTNDRLELDDTSVIDSDAGSGMIPPVAASTQIRAASATAAAGTSPTLAQEVQYINGLNPNGTVATSNDFWVDEDGKTGTFKYGSSTAGTGATVTFSFDPSSNFTQQEKNTVLVGMANWEAAANVTFVEDDNAADVKSTDLLIHRGSDGSAYTTNNQTAGSGATLGHATGQVTISIDTSVPGFDLSGSFDTSAGYGQSTITHELGHFLGLGHGGAYNGNVNASTQQFSAYDVRQYSTMSYIFYPYNSDAKYFSQNPNPGTDWGFSNDGYYRAAPHTIQMLDIEAIQQLYGVSTNTPFSGGQIYGFNSNIVGLLHNTYDFTVNNQPVVTLYNQGTGNTLDVSGYSVAERIDLHDGKFSDVGGLKNNVAIAIGTKIDAVVGGSGDDTLVANDDGDTLTGGSGNDTITGGHGNDTVNGGPGTDTIDGGDGADTLYGNGGVDTLHGGAGNDVIDGGAGNDIMDGGADINTASYASAPSAVTVSLALQGQAQNTIGAGVDTLTNFQNLTGSAYNDTLSGDGNANLIHGGSGDDVIMAGAGADTVYGDPGNDTLYGNGGADILYGNGGADRLIGGAGADTLTGGAGNDTFVYSLPTDSTIAAPDRITDFTHGSDKIDLTALHLANAGDVKISTGGGLTLINIDSNNDGIADMLIQVVGTVTTSDIVTGIAAPAAVAHSIATDLTTSLVHHNLATSLHAVAVDHGLYG